MHKMTRERETILIDQTMEIADRQGLCVRRFVCSRIEQQGPITLLPRFQSSHSRHNL